MPRPEEGQDIPHHHHLIVPSEIIETPAGSGLVVEGYSDTPGGADCLRDSMAARGFREIKDGKIPGTSIRVGLSRARWNATWEPKGPKPNYGKPPADPRAN